MTFKRKKAGRGGERGKGGAKKGDRRGRGEGR